MNQEPKSSGSFGGRGRRPRRGPRRLPRRPTEKTGLEVHSTAAPVAEPPAEVTSATAEISESATPFAVPPAVETDTPPSSTLASQDASVMAQAPTRPPEQNRPQPRGNSPDRPRHFQQRSAPPPPAQKSRSLQQASQEVLAIIEQLNDVLCDMEHVSKMLDDAEIQQGSDEKEIESLRSALRQFQNPPHQRPPPPRERDRGQDRGQPRHQDRYRERNPQHRQQVPGEPRPPQPPPEGQSGPPQSQGGQEDPEPHT